MTKEEMKLRLQQEIKPARYRHTLGVADTAVKMAERWGVSTEKAYLAGLLHDCGKERGDALSHGPIGAEIARKEYGVEDPEVLSAIDCHTTGKANMSLLDKIIFIADYIEPGRDRAPRLEELRKLAYEDLDLTMILILEDTLIYLKKSGKVIDQRSLVTYNYYIKDKKRFVKQKVEGEKE